MFHRDTRRGVFFSAKILRTGASGGANTVVFFASLCASAPKPKHFVQTWTWSSRFERLDYGHPIFSAGFVYFRKGALPQKRG